MTESDAASQRADFLERLDVALRHVPHGLATEIRSGIAEELEGLDAATVSERIRQLGDPDLIAREAQSEIRRPGVIAAERKVPLSHRRGYAIAAALVFAFGGFVVPVVGWIVGAVMVADGKLWRRWEKIVAIVLPFAVGILITVVSWIVALISSRESEGQEHNPLVPSPGGLGLWHAGILLALILIPAIGGWLLWRLRRR
ncbi:HAAS signaling domain-containing protein [Microbacterium murale]|uniref:Membrane protein n=1 Tax=Microbacterium murale TaxID=1081040 RepID=A0ABU0P5F1_9MICO|nr:hypothetical protein [Microbacterium murale]MDQ0642556.1 putative membrane protein [Microbacterium murale]